MRLAWSAARCRRRYRERVGPVRGWFRCRQGRALNSMRVSKRPRLMGWVAMGMGGRVWEWVKLFGDSTARQIPKFQPGGFPFQRRELDGGRQGAGPNSGGCGLWRRVRGCRGQGECPGSGHCSTGAPLRAALFHAPNWERRRDSTASNWALRHHCIFGLVPRKQPPFLHLFNDRSATWIRILIALNFLCLVNTMDEIRNSAHGWPPRPISLTKRDEISVSRKKI